MKTEEEFRKKIDALLERNLNDLDLLLKWPNVKGYSQTVQKRIRKGEEINELVLRIYVSKKLPLSELKPHEILPEKLTFLDEKKKKQEVRIDVVEDRGEFVILGIIDNLLGRKRKPKALDRKSKIRPVKGGFSEGNFTISAGSGGVLCRRSSAVEWYHSTFGIVSEIDAIPDGTIGRLSNAHVYCSNIFVDVSKQEDRRIAQPASFDDPNVERNFIRNLVSFVLVQESQPNFIEAAFGVPLRQEDDSAEVEGIGIPERLGKETEIQKGVGIWGSGRSPPEIFEGTILDFPVSARVNMGDGKYANFRNQVLVSKCLNPGHSGSTGFIKGTRIALLSGWAGSDSSSIFCPLEPALRAMSLELVTEQVQPSITIVCEMKKIEEENGEINLIVKAINSKTKQAIEGVDVLFDSIKVIKTGINGLAQFGPIQKGSHELILTKIGYEEFHKDFEA